MSKIRVGLAANNASIVIDGESIATEKVAGVQIVASPGDAPQLWLCWKGEIDVDGDGVGVRDTIEKINAEASRQVEVNNKVNSEIMEALKGIIEKSGRRG